MLKTKKIIILILSVILIFSCFCISASATTTYNFSCSRPQLQGSDCYVEFVTDTGIAGVVYVKAVLSPNLTSTTLNISFNASVSDNYLRIGVNPSSYSFDGEQMEITVRGLYYLDYGEFGATTVESLRSCLFLGQIGNIIAIRSYNCNVSDIGVPNGDFVFAYANEVNLNEKLDTIIDILQNGGQSQIGAIIDNANENTDEIKQNQDENTQEIIDNQNQLQENEKNEAQSSGNSGTDELTNVMPNESQGFIDSLSNFVATMSTTETQCSLTFPSIKVPALSGLFPETVLTDEIEFTFSDAIKLIPLTIMSIIQAVTTLALIVFCFKELYDTISDALTRKKASE